MSGHFRVGLFFYRTQR